MAMGDHERGQGTVEKQRRPRRTPGTWRVTRRFRPVQRPKSRNWPDVFEDVAYLTGELGR
jgi:hypothetical protein